ncbi:MAG: GGDEF domain-containing protein [Candidatus Omnitrophica bacterium]|nr:GGDEF domain-containing protein [Candidatus Omnitrophota bacterium]MCB9747374.1 GGDEF domain-containing protein [Candidatus Omnitrophota bacterium]
MIILLSLITVIYIFILVQVAYRFVGNSAQLVQQKVDETEGSYNQLETKKEKLHKQKINLENKALEIFTLYEMTKDVSKSLNESVAFDIFKTRLSQHVSFTNCRLLDPDDQDIKLLRKSSEHFIFTLRSKRHKIGYLDIEGILENDREKVNILAHQFALSLRRVKLHREIEKIAITDGLTGVNTRRYTMERLNEEYQRSKIKKIPLSFLMIDVDFFKKINDKYGHLSGDQVLREISEVIKENIREIDIAGRYGGEEFCIVLPDTDKAGAQYVAGRIRKAAEDKIFKVYDNSLKVTVSIGTATFPLDAQKVEELIDKADWALYRAKKQGRNRICSFGIYDE